MLAFEPAGRNPIAGRQREHTAFHRRQPLLHQPHRIVVQFDFINPQIKRFEQDHPGCECESHTRLKLFDHTSKPLCQMLLPRDRYGAIVFSFMTQTIWKETCSSESAEEIVHGLALEQRPDAAAIVVNETVIKTVERIVHVDKRFLLIAYDTDTVAEIDQIDALDCIGPRWVCQPNPSPRCHFPDALKPFRLEPFNIAGKPLPR